MPGCPFLLDEIETNSSHVAISLCIGAFSFFHLSYFTLTAGLPKGCNGLGVAGQGPGDMGSPSWFCLPPRAALTLPRARDSMSAPQGRQAWTQ